VSLLAAGKSLIRIAAVFLAVAWFAQRSVLFPATRLPPGSCPPGAEPVALQLASGGVGEALFLAPMSPRAGRSPLIIFTHGNGELADHWVDEFARPQSWGWAVLLVEYPGYGRSPGSPSEESILAAQEAAYQWALGDRRIDASLIVAYGRSLGGAPAVRLAARHPIAGLILESAFTSVRPLAAAYLLPGFLVRDPFDNLAALAGYRGPLLVLHGREDRVVPVAHGRVLAAAVPGAEFHELECGHNDCPRPWPIVRRFLAPTDFKGAGAEPGA